jgi:sortase A
VIFLGKRITFSIICILIIGILGFQTLAREDVKQTPAESMNNSVNEKHHVDKERHVKYSLEKEFVLLDSLKEKKADLENTLKVQEEGITPSRIKIPSLEIDTEIIPVGLLENGEMAVPKETNIVGWYNKGVMPGAKGNSVVAGHVDSKEGPAIFFYLKNLEKGQEILISDKEGHTRKFVVREKKSYKNDEAPIEEIFGVSSKRNLNLITCTGTFNHALHEYPDRLVVYTELVEEDEQSEVKTPSAPTHVDFDMGTISWHAVGDKYVVGYRIYKKEPDSKVYKRIASVSAHERKSYYDQDAKEGSKYYITTVNLTEKESVPSVEMGN